MTYQGWAQLIMFSFIGIGIVGTLNLVRAVPRGPFLGLFAVSCVASAAIYLWPPGIQGRDDFHSRLIYASLAAGLVALVANVVWAQRPWMGPGQRARTIAVSLLGVVAPVFAFFGLFLGAGG